MEYRTIYDYLDAVFQVDTNPTKKDIMEAKKQYYKQWHKDYNRRRRKHRREFTLGFTTDVLKRIRNKKGRRTISKYLYDAVFDALNDCSKPVFDLEQLTAIHQKLMQLIALLEEQEKSSQIEQILERIEALEIQFSNLIDRDYQK